MGREPLVVVVEPVPALREVLKAALEDEFLCQVEDRDSVRNLLELVKERKPVFIVLDVELPGVTRFLNDLKDDPCLGAIPVIGANLVGRQTDREVLAAGYDACCPGDLKHLEDFARRYLAKRAMPTISSLPAGTATG